MDEQAQQDAAEQVRQHLVALRGGAPFLSSADGQLLLRWLDEAVPVPRICIALEHAAEARRKRPSRIPLSLSHARRHLGKVTTPSPSASEAHPFEPLAGRLRAESGASSAALHALADALLALADDDDLVDGGLVALRTCYGAVWTALPASSREDLIEDAVDTLGSLPMGMDRALVMAAAEEQARLHHLGQWPWLSANTLWELAAR